MSVHRHSRGHGEIHLAGRWNGDLGDQWTLQAVLRWRAEGKVDGTITWKLNDSPVSLKWYNQRGQRGEETVDGTLKEELEGSLQLELNSNETTKNPELLCKSEYKISISPTRDTFGGRSKPEKMRGLPHDPGTFNGNVTFLREPAPSF
jgi:hypothetical protein